MKRVYSLLKDTDGSVAATMVILMFVFGGFLAVVIDMAHVQTVKNELANAADAAALAGARRLMPLNDPSGGTTPPPWPVLPFDDAIQAAVIQVANETSASNTVNPGESSGTAQGVYLAEVITGHWDFIPDTVKKTGGTFTPNQAGIYASNTNAVMVTARVNPNSNNGSVVVTLAQKLFGVTVSPSAKAIAAVGCLTTLDAGPNRGVIVPNIDFINKIYNSTYNDDGTPKYPAEGSYPTDKYWYLVMQPAMGSETWANADNAGYGLPDGYINGDTPNPSNIIPVIEDGMKESMSINQTVNLGNGEATPILGALADAIAAAGGILEWTVPAVDSNSFNHPLPIADFFTIQFTDVWKAGANKQHPFPQDFIDGTGGIQEQTKFVGVIQFRILPKQGTTGSPGPAVTNTVTLMPKLVWNEAFNY